MNLYINRPNVIIMTLTSISIDTYSVLYSFLTPNEMKELNHVSREQYREVERYKKKYQKKECFLCKDDWVYPLGDDIFDDLDQNLHEFEINQRLDWILYSNQNAKPGSFMCKSCQSIVWDSNTIHDIYRYLPDSIYLHYIFTDYPWAYLYKEKTKLWQPICIDLISNSLEDAFEE